MSCSKCRDKTEKFGYFKTQLCNALAPSIYENEDVKFGILCQLFGGTRKGKVLLNTGNLKSEIKDPITGADLGFSRGGGADFQKIFENFDDFFFLGRPN